LKKNGVKAAITPSGGFFGPIKRAKSAITEGWEGFLGRLPHWLSPWVRDAVDVGLTVLVIIVVLKALFGADMLVPLVVVTSESMVHEAGSQAWLSWMQERGIPGGVAETFPLSGGFNMGDMIVVKDPNAALGDVIIYERDLDHLTFQSRDPIIHRVVGAAHVVDYAVGSTEGTLDCQSAATLQQQVDAVRRCQAGSGYCPLPRYPKTGNFTLFITKGDHNEGSDQCNSRLNISYPVTDAQVTGRAFLRLPYLGWPKLILSIFYRILTLQF
jgi:hypothetical protein